jgi:hypothetical protein
VVAERPARERFVCEQSPYSILLRGIEAHVLGLDDAILDRIDEIVAAGTNIDSADEGWSDPALEPRGAPPTVDRPRVRRVVPRMRKAAAPCRGRGLRRDRLSDVQTPHSFLNCSW